MRKLEPGETDGYGVAVLLDGGKRGVVRIPFRFCDELSLSCIIILDVVR
jgi:hypothetical protein